MLVPSTERLFLSAIGKKATATHTLRRRGPLRTRRGPGRAAAHRGRGVHHPRRRHRSRPSRREVDAVDTGRRWGVLEERGGHGSSDRAPRACSVRAAALASQLVSVHLASRQGGRDTTLALHYSSWPGRTSPGRSAHAHARRRDGRASRVVLVQGMDGRGLSHTLPLGSYADHDTLQSRPLSVCSSLCLPLMGPESYTIYTSCPTYAIVFPCSLASEVDESHLDPSVPTS